MILLGACLALLFSRILFPWLAIRQLRLATADIFYRLAAAYMLEKHITSLNWHKLASEHASKNKSSNVDEVNSNVGSGDPMSIIIASTEKEVQESSVPELAKFAMSSLRAHHIGIQRAIAKALLLVELADSEPRLKPSFSGGSYRRVLHACRRMLSVHRFMAHLASTGFSIRRYDDLILPLNSHRLEMTANVLMFYYILASSFRTQTPLPAFLPPALKSRQRVAKAFLKLSVLQLNKGRFDQTTVDVMYWGLYSALGKSVLNELEHVGQQLFEKLFF
jgi:hypothetical protein